MKLTPMDGREVAKTSLSIRKAGDGLSKALTVDPVELHHDDEVTVVLRCKVVKVRFDAITDTELLERVHMADTLEATIIDGSLVEEHLEQQRVRIEKAAGVERLPFGQGGTGEGGDPGTDPAADPLGEFGGAEPPAPTAIGSATKKAARPRKAAGATKKKAGT